MAISKLRVLCGEKALSSRIGSLIWAGLVLGLAACGNVSPTPAAPPPGPTAPPWPTPTPDLVSTARFEPAPCPFVLPEEYVQGENVTCGYLVVPENRAALPSRALRLAVSIFHPAGGATAPDPLIYLAGGPGGSVLELLRYQFPDFFAPVLEATGRDLILFDQRGVGRSQPALDCPNVDALLLEKMDQAPAPGQAMAAQIVAAYLDCAAELRQVADLTQYHSAASAADVEDLRMALGYETVNLWGVSYGTRLALTVMRDHPAGLRSVVLDAVYPPDVDLYVTAPANFARALTLFFDDCAANPVCAEHYPALEQHFWATVSRLDTWPVTTTITNPLTGQEYTSLMTGAALTGFVFQVLYETEVKYLLPQLMDDASRDDFTTINRLRGALLAQASVSSRGMMFSVQCHEELPFSSPEQFAAALAPYPELAGLYTSSVLGDLTYRICAGWGAGQAGAGENEPVVSTVPTLILAGEADPVTPPEWGRRAAATLAHGYFFEFPSAGHGVTQAPCGRELLRAFLANPMVAPESRCLKSLQP